MNNLLISIYKIKNVLNSFNIRFNGTINKQLRNEKSTYEKVLPIFSTNA